jgi:hypothetical protein
MLRGDRSAGHYGVDDQGGFDQLTVRNGVVRTFYLGVAAFNFADKVVVSGVLASGNVIAGISLSGFSDSVKSSTGSGNGDTGIAVGGTAGAKVQSSTASGNGSYGINAGGASASVKSSTATGNGILGINIDGPSASLISSIASGNGEGGISVNGDATQIKGNRAEANGFAGGSSDLAGLGIVAFGYTKAPVGTNIARGNDDTAECNPAFLC